MLTADIRHHITTDFVVYREFGLLCGSNIQAATLLSGLDIQDGRPVVQRVWADATWLREGAEVFIGQRRNPMPTRRRTRQNALAAQ